MNCKGGVILAILCLGCFDTAVALTASERQSILDWHNNLRRAMPAESMPDLVWDSKLETVAQNYANQCNYGHNSARKTQYADQGGSGSVGENIASWCCDNSPGAFTPTQLMSLWGEERNYWTYPNSCNSTDPGCLHWTQIIWSTTTKLGCGIAICTGSSGSAPSGSHYIVCNYNTAGNGPGQPYTAKPSSPTSSSPPPTSSSPPPTSSSPPPPTSSSPPPSTSSPPTSGGSSPPSSPDSQVNSPSSGAPSLLPSPLFLPAMIALLNLAILL